MAKSSGFSLLEVVLVTAIIAVVAAIAAPRFGMARGRYQADLAAQRIVADLERAQSCATAGSCNRTVEFYVTAGTYKLVEIASLDGRASDCIVDLAASPYEAGLVSAVFGDDTKVIFNGWGLPDTAGTVTIQVRNEQRTIVLNGETGEATIQ